DALLAEETARLEHEEHHDDGERDDVAELGAAGDEGRRRRLEDAEEQAADDRAVDVAEPADRRGGEADDAAGDAHDEVNLAVVEPAEDPGHGARPEPRKKVASTVRSRFTPIICAASGSCATARIATPIFVRRMTRSTATIAASPIPRIARFS